MCDLCANKIKCVSQRNLVSNSKDRLYFNKKTNPNLVKNEVIIILNVLTSICK